MLAMGYITDSRNFVIDRASFPGHIHRIPVNCSGSYLTAVLHLICSGNSAHIIKKTDSPESVSFLFADYCLSVYIVFLI